jgi:hypothetical protein
MSPKPVSRDEFWKKQIAIVSRLTVDRSGNVLYVSSTHKTASSVGNPKIQKLMVRVVPCRERERICH